MHNPDQAATEDRITFLIGAGASYGHINAREGKTPPVMSNFLSSAVKRGMLTAQEFPELVKECTARGGKGNLLQSCLSLELAATGLESFLGSISDLWALQLSRFFLYRYLGWFCRYPIKDYSAYRKLARYIGEHRNTVNGIISLNYDTLCESALGLDGIEVNYTLTPSSSGGLLYLKPHGSVNFRFPMARGFISVNVANWPSFLRSHNALIETNTFSGQWVESYKPSFSFQKDFLTGTSVSETRRLEYIPALVPPLGRKKYHEQFDSYQLIWNGIDYLLERTNILLVIGCAMNDEEFKLWDSVNRHLAKNSLIKIVSSSLSGAQNVKDKFNSSGFERVIPLDVVGFYEYARDYLEVGIL